MEDLDDENPKRGPPPRHRLRQLCRRQLPPPRGGFGDDAIRVDRPHPSRLLRDLGEGQEPLVVHRVPQRLGHQPHVPERGDGRVSQNALPHLLRDRIRAAPKIRRVRSGHRVEDGRLPALLPLLLGAFVFFSLDPLLLPVLDGVVPLRFLPLLGRRLTPLPRRLVFVRVVGRQVDGVRINHHRGRAGEERGAPARFGCTGHRPTR